MPEYYRNQQHSAPATSKPGIILPPLSKYYYGPAQGWNSTDSSPSHTGMYRILPPTICADRLAGSSWSLSHHDIPTSLPYRLPARPPTAGSSHWATRSFYSAEALQGWHSSPPPSESPANFLATESKGSDGYPGLDTGQSDVNATWDNSPPSTSKRGIIINQNAPHGSEPVSKPPLPVRPNTLLLAFQFS